VYPKPEPIGDETSSVANVRRPHGFSPARYWPGSFSLRDYQPQDDLRHIDWKATARSRQLTVREFTAEDERRITIILDTSQPYEADPEEFNARFEQGVVQAASLLKHFVDERAE